MSDFGSPSKRGDGHHGVPVGEEPELLRRALGGVQTQAWNVPQRYLFRFHHGELRQGAGILTQDPCPHDLELLLQRFEGVGGKGHALLDDAQEQQGNDPCTQRQPGPVHRPGSQRCPAERDHCEQGEQLPRKEPVEQRHLGQRTHACAQQVGTVDGTDAVSVAGKADADEQCHQQERHHQQQVDRCQPEPLPGIPEQLQGVEGELFRQQEDQRHGETETHRQQRPCTLEAPQQSPGEEGHQGAAGAVAQQCQADDHVGEVVPLQNGEEAHQQHLEGERCCRQQCHCHQEER